ncbi:site-specific recombinase XerD [Dysgonomonas alginatilytica]|uniref:Site-specific recombinase XerD n=1 Tax=Dysgonomonas alginatilytica TaxID=1605892 RepID=A0A2V3PK73_9BACT|nr:site-specific integrase [Dysgonomonas alginatilytica]PXV58452.1 site-specific recombinase XerD [Dysgonomonas alginatilytica]
MKRSTFRILFYINRNKQKKDGKSPILGRITVDGMHTQFSLQEYIEPELWSAQDNCAIGKNKACKELNLKLEKYRQDLKYHYNKQVEDNAYVTAESLKNTLLGIGTHEVMLLKEFEAHNKEFFQSIGITKVKSTYKSYNTAYNTLRNFIRYKYDMDDIAFNQLSYTFIEEFDFYMRVTLGYKTNTRHGRIRMLKYIVMRAIKKEVIRNNPFADYHVKSSEGERRWLSKEELDLIMQTPIKRIAVNYVRNLFVFAAFTGLAFIDLQTLKWSEIFTDKRGMRWIRKKRSKTGTECIIPLLDIPLQIIKYYKGSAKDGRVFDIGSYSLVLLYMQELRELLNMKTLCFHQSRHTYATTVCLSNGVPIETLCIMMGHRNISTTQIYSKITKNRINEDMQLLEKSIDRKYSLPEQMQHISSVNNNK